MAAAATADRSTRPRGIVCSRAGLALAAFLSAACVIVLAAPVRADAATVTVTSRTQDSEILDTIVFWAAPGEYNDVTATAARNENGGAWLIHDGGAVLDAAAPCQSVDQHTVSCAAYPEHYLSNARFELGDLDDRLQTVSPPEEADELGVIGEFFADGGPGNDRLSGDSDGAISPAPPTTGANVGAWLSLSGISFRCAPSGQDGCP